MDFPRLMTAMITPFDENKNIDFSLVRKMARYLADNASQGIVVSGTTGESPTLSRDEKLQLFSAVKEEVGREVQVWAGVGSNSTEPTAELASEASQIGIDGIMAVTPYYNKPSQEGLYRHFRRIAESTELPVMLYNVPGRTGVNLLPATVKRLAAIDNIAALKEASGSMDQMSELAGSTPEDFIIYCGDDSLTLPMMALGAFGVVSIASHLIGNEIGKMIEAATSGNYVQARNIHARLFPIFKLLFVTTNPVPLKVALRILGRDRGILREPLCPPSETESRQIADGLQSFGFAF